MIDEVAGVECDDGDGPPECVADQFAGVESDEEAGALLCGGLLNRGTCSDDENAVIDEATASMCDPETRCFEHCLARGFCCNDHNVGSNQLISCAQACMIRARGTSRAECDGHCAEHTAARGCSRTVNGHHYSMCSSCTDLDSHCVHGVQGSDACETGCAQVS